MLRRDRRIKKWPGLAEEARMEALAIFFRIGEEMDILFEMYENGTSPQDLTKQMLAVKKKARNGIVLLRQVKRSGNGKEEEAGAVAQREKTVVERAE